jgi:hypothetical protein
MQVNKTGGDDYITYSEETHSIQLSVMGMTFDMRFLTFVATKVHDLVLYIFQVARILHGQ